VTYTLETLLAREEITDVIKRLARGTDRLDADLIVSCYHEATMHFVGPPLIRLDGEVAHADTYCVAHHVSKPDAAGTQTDMVLGLRYVDRFERRDGRWRIAKRVCAFDWTTTVAVDAATRYQFEAGWTVGARDRSDITYRGV
jgi:SnoaL-like protein